MATISNSMTGIVRMASLAADEKPPSLSLRHSVLPMESIGRRMVESEKLKLKAKLGAAPLSEKDMLSVEMMCENIVGKFFEAPTDYLRSGGCRCPQKMSDFELLVRIFEDHESP